MRLRSGASGSALVVRVAKRHCRAAPAAVMAAFGADAYRPASQAASLTGAWADDYDERLVRAGLIPALTARRR